MTIKKFEQRAKYQNGYDRETDDWQKASLHLEVTGSSVGFKGYLDDDKRFDAPGGFSLAKSILNLHKITTEGGNNQWNRAIFNLTPNGKFDMEFIWDKDLDEEVRRLSK